MAHDASILNDTNFWYGVAFVTFVGMIAKLAGRAILGALDGQILRIRNELDEAKRLRAEAETSLASCRQKQDEALQEAETIVADAKALAAKIRRESEVELAETLRRHEQTALERIHSAQEEAAAEIRAYIFHQAMTEAKGKLAKDLAGDRGISLVDQAIADLPKVRA